MMYISPVVRPRRAPPLVLILLSASACGANAPPAEGSPEPERVSVGYGDQAPERITGAIASLSEKDLGTARVSRIEELLRGRLAGVQVHRLPGGDFTVRIRGAGGLSGSGDPLVVVDGVPLHSASLGRALDGIHPADIARIDVLKDAGSAAIYGVRGANGVIIVTTRRRR